MELSQLIRYSPKRLTLFTLLQKQIAPGSQGLKPLCPTRWTVRNGAISVAMSNYSVLAEALEDYGRKAGDLLSLMEKFDTFFGLKLSHLIFSGTEQLSLTLQGKDTTIQ